MKARFKAKKCFLKAALFLILKGKKIRKLFKKQGFWYFVTRVNSSKCKVKSSK